MNNDFATNAGCFLIILYLILCFIFPVLFLPVVLGLFVYTIYAAFKMTTELVDGLRSTKPPPKAPKTTEPQPRQSRQKTISSHKAPNARSKKRSRSTKKKRITKTKPQHSLTQAELLFRNYGIDKLWHLTHRDNVPSILTYGILNHHDSLKIMPERKDISDALVQRWRKAQDPQYKRIIHDYCPLYIQPLNPMLYRRRDINAELTWLAVSVNVFNDNTCLVTDGNAASKGTRFYRTLADIDKLPWDVLRAKYWSEFPDGKRQRCAEVLIYPRIDKSHIEQIYCFSKSTKSFLAQQGIDSTIGKNLYFVQD